MAKEKDVKEKDVKEGKMKKGIAVQDFNIGIRRYEGGKVYEFTEDQCIRLPQLIETDLDLGARRAQAWKEDMNKMFTPKKNQNSVTKK